MIKRRRVVMLIQHAGCPPAHGTAYGESELLNTGAGGRYGITDLPKFCPYCSATPCSLNVPTWLDGDVAPSAICGCVEPAPCTSCCNCWFRQLNGDGFCPATCRDRQRQAANDRLYQKDPLAS
jgi:hypothetical protein